MTLIDTSAWIEFFRSRGEPEAKARVAAYIDSADAAYCGPVLLELWSGARKSEKRAIRRALSFCTCLDFPLACWGRAGDMEQMLRQKGITVPRDDLLVAAASLHHGVPIYARDAHFAMILDAGIRDLRLAE